MSSNLASNPQLHFPLWERTASWLTDRHIRHVRSFDAMSATASPTPRHRVKLCLMLIVCAMFRLGEPRPLRRPLGLSSPTVPLFSRADWGGRSASAPSAADRRSRWAMSASFSSSSRSSVQFQVRRNRRPSRFTKLLRPMVDRCSATSWTRRKRSYVRECMP